jgi:hypothetical protein
VLGIHAVWDNPEKTVILQSFDDPWDWDDVIAAQYEINSLLDTVTYKVHLISDMKKTPRIPGNYFEEMSKLVDNVHPNVGLSITVTANPLLKEMFYIFTAKRGGVDFEYRFMNTVEEARRFLTNWKP